MDPAYEQTSVKAREMYLAEHPESQVAEKSAQESAQREAEAKAAAQREQAKRDAQIARIHREMELLNQ